MQQILVWHSSPATQQSDDDDVVATWNAMAGAMTDVVTTIKINERKSSASESRLRNMVLVVVCTVVCAFGVNWYQGDQISQNSREHGALIRDKLDESAVKQDALLGAIIALAKAQAMGIEAGADYSPQKDALARAEALVAQKMALEAKKMIENDPVAKARTDEKIEAVDRAARKAVDEADGGNKLKNSTTSEP